MSTGSASYPLDDSWVAAVHATEDDLAPLVRQSPFAN
jgi:hypothetical protein